MSDPLLTHDPEEGDLTIDHRAKPERSRTFTPGLDHKAAPIAPFRRVVSRETGPEEDLASLEAGPQAAAPPVSWDTAEVAGPARHGGPSLPTLQRNKTAEFLNSFQPQTDPDVLDQRLNKVLRLSAVALLSAIVLAVLGAIFLFRAKPTLAVIPVGPRVRAPVREESIDPHAAAEAATATLGAFLASSAVAERQKLIGLDEPMPACLSASARVPALERSTFSPTGARTVRLGRRVAVLVPMIDQSGVSRTAALLEQDGEFRVDWRSVVTPEPVSWDDFVAAPLEQPRLFRVELTDGSDPTRPGTSLSALRPSGSPSSVTMEIDPHSRLGEDLRAAFVRRNGKPLPADVYLQGKPGEPLRIVGWTPDKWAL